MQFPFFHLFVLPFGVILPLKMSKDNNHLFSCMFLLPLEKVPNYFHMDTPHRSSNGHYLSDDTPFTSNPAHHSITTPFLCVVKKN